MVNLESMGVPGLYVATVEFVDAAAEQAEALGCSPPAVFGPHPIQDRSDAEMRAIADAAAIEIIRELVAKP